VSTWAYYVSRQLIKGIAAPFVRVRVLRPEITRRPGPWILAANHISHFDPPLIGAAARRKIDFMGMRELFGNPISGAWMRAVDCFPVDRARLDRAAVRTALQRLQKGRVTGIFPEGGIRDGAGSVLEGAPVRPGVAGIAQIAGVPIIPCVIIGTDRLYILPRLWRPGRRIPVWIGFGEPLTASPEGGRAAARAAFETAMAEAFQSLASEMREHFQLSDDDLPKSPVWRRAEGR
jgi:1-acyl-sn-glycerol-3-phosphate acyltransferase